MDAVGFRAHAVSDLDDRHAKVAGQDSREHARAAGIQVLDHDKGHARAVRKVGEELPNCFEAASGRADTDDGAGSCLRRVALRIFRRLRHSAPGCPRPRWPLVCGAERKREGAYRPLRLTSETRKGSGAQTGRAAKTGKACVSAAPSRTASRGAFVGTEAFWSSLGRECITPLAGRRGRVDRSLGESGPRRNGARTRRVSRTGDARRARCFCTVRLAMRIPSFRSSPRMRSAPQSRLPRAIVRMSSTVSGATRSAFSAMSSSRDRNASSTSPTRTDVGRVAARSASSPSSKRCQHARDCRDP
jgi:hypothetical protein